MAREKRGYISHDMLLGYLLLSPIIVLMCVLVVFPFLASIGISLTDMRIGTAHINLIGIDNYISILSSREGWNVILNTLEYAAGALLLKTFFGLFVAQVFNYNFKGRDIVRGIAFIPYVAPMIVCGIAMRWIFDDLFGIMNYVLKSCRIIQFNIAWLAKPNTAMGTVIFTNFWKGVPFFIISFLAAMQTIPIEQYEVAQMDGAGPARRFISITLPSIMGIVLLTISLSTIWTVNDFATIYTMTGGGPLDATMTVPIYTFRQGFELLDLAKASTMSIIFLPIFLFLLYFATRKIYQ
jgi:multiple sugar transport system permease protein